MTWFGEYSALLTIMVYDPKDKETKETDKGPGQWENIAPPEVAIASGVLPEADEQLPGQEPIGETFIQPGERPALGRDDA